MRKAWTSIFWLLLAAAALAATPAARAEQPLDRVLEQAIDAYSRAQEASLRQERLAAFREAQLLFEHALNQGARSADLYTNLGNAAVQAERLGPAILAYRRALELDPNQARAAQNLQHARSLLPAWVPRPEPKGAFESFFFWRSILSPAEQAGVAGFSFLLGALLLAVAIRWRSPFARVLSILPFLAWAGLLTSAAIEASVGRKAEAVIVADEVIARAADSPNAQVRFAEPLPGGTEVSVLESRQHWVHVLLANGRDAWVTRGSVEEV